MVPVFFLHWHRRKDFQERGKNLIDFSPKFAQQISFHKGRLASKRGKKRPFFQWSFPLIKKKRSASNGCQFL